MTGFYLLIVFPIFAAGGFTVVHALGRLMSGARGAEFVTRHGGWVYFALLTVPAAVAATDLARADAVDRAGIRWPSLEPLDPVVAVILTVVCAIVVGAALYFNELLLSIGLRRLMTRLPKSSATVLEGQSRIFGGAAPPLQSYMTLSALIVAAEEFLWRGFLFYILSERLHLGTAKALATTAALFAVNHLFFGLRNVLLKAIEAVAWGLILLATSSLLAPFLSHLTFQYFVWRRMYRRSLRSAPA